MFSNEQLVFDFFKYSETEFNFENFFATKKNLELVSLLQSWASASGSGIIYIWGEPSVGKTHLIHSSLKNIKSRSIYIPLKDFRDLEPDVFDNLANVGVLALDDIGLLAGRSDFEESLFRLFNAVVSKQARLLLSGRDHPLRQGFVLKDLISRLNSHSVYKVCELLDHEKITALALIASQKGMTADRTVWDYVLKRSRRDMSSLVELLKELDEFSLMNKRSLTIPLVKSFISLKADI